jgi:hypothetical protein
MILTRENRITWRKTCPSATCSHHKFHVDWLGRESRPPRWEALVLVVHSSCCDGARLCLCGTGPLTGPLSIPQMIYVWIWNWGEMILTGETEKPVKVPRCPSQIPPGREPCPPLWEVFLLALQPDSYLCHRTQWTGDQSIVTYRTTHKSGRDSNLLSQCLDGFRLQDYRNWQCKPLPFTTRNDAKYVAAWLHNW